MKKLTIVFAVAVGVGLGVPAAGIAKPKDPVTAESAAAKGCAAEKRADRGAFGEAYGEMAMRRCIESGRAEARESIDEATEDCRSERARSRRAFKREHGVGGKGRNAFKRCISSGVRTDRRNDSSEFKNAAEECRAERGDTEESRAAFEEKYGTKKGDMPMYRPQPRNAFGKCVSSKVSRSGKT